MRSHGARGEPRREVAGERPIGLAPGAPLDAVGQDARKYSTSNPVVRRLIARWLASLRTAIGEPAGTIVDVGVGEGLALARVVPVDRPVVGVEYRAGKLLEARRRLPALAGACADAGMLPLRPGSADLVLCIEVLEHLVDPARAVRELARVTRDRCVVSVPWEPWFRAGNLGRGKNLRRAGNDPEHVQQFTPARLRALLHRDFEQVDVRACFPWLIGVSRSPR